jgi:hypothetical protein
MSNSQRALAASHTPPKPNNGVGEMPKLERPLSEIYRLTGEEWADADAAAELFTELKTATLSKMKTTLIAERGDMPEARAERIVKSSPAWEKYIRDMVAAKQTANKLKVRLDSLKIVNREEIDRNANSRAERRF